MIDKHINPNLNNTTMTKKDCPLSWLFTKNKEGKNETKFKPYMCNSEDMVVVKVLRDINSNDDSTIVSGSWDNREECPVDKATALSSAENSSSSNDNSNSNNNNTSDDDNDDNDSSDDDNNSSSSTTGSRSAFRIGPLTAFRMGNKPFPTVDQEPIQIVTEYTTVEEIKGVDWDPFTSSRNAHYYYRLLK